MKYPERHPYSDRAAFDRLMLVIATLIQHPGIGCRDEEVEPGQHDALAFVAEQLQQVASTARIDLPHFAPPTLRKDLETLRNYGILEQRMYRWGYYLGTGGLNREELSIALQALRSQAQTQGDPSVRKIERRLEKRLRGMALGGSASITYPVRSQLDRTIIHTDPEEMRRKRTYRQTLFDRLDELESAIVQGEAVLLLHRKNLYGKASSGEIRVYPLQLIYHEIAWYLLCEECETEHLSILRLDRLAPYLEKIRCPLREPKARVQSLEIAHQLLKNGWGLFLGEREEQRSEKDGAIPLVEARVRFSGSVAEFICEGERRHPRQRVIVGAKDPQSRLRTAEYRVRLPARSLPEFFRWVNRFMEQAEVLQPLEWVEKYAARSRQMMEQYSRKGSEASSRQ